MENLTFLTFAFFIALSSALSGFAQEAKTIEVGRSERFQIGSPVRVGDKLLKPGRYEVRHLIEGDNHLIVFRKVKLGYRNNFGEQKLGDEVARVTSKIIFADKKIGDIKFVAGKNSAGERTITEVVIKGEKIKHFLLDQLIVQ